jgi:hypothetical protein
VRRATPVWRRRRRFTMPLAMFFSPGCSHAQRVAIARAEIP